MQCFVHSRVSCFVLDLVQTRWPWFRQSFWEHQNLGSLSKARPVHCVLHLNAETLCCKGRDSVLSLALEKQVKSSRERGYPGCVNAVKGLHGSERWGGSSVIPLLGVLRSDYFTSCFSVVFLSGRMWRRERSFHSGSARRIDLWLLWKPSKTFWFIICYPLGNWEVFVFVYIYLICK